MSEVALTDDGRVHMVDDQGIPVTVEVKDVRGALDAGFQIEGAGSVERRHIEREYGDLGSRAATFGEGALEGATLGLGTAGLSAILGDDYREDARLRRDANPGTHLAGEITGAVAPILASGGTGAAARGVSAIGTPARAAGGLATLAEGGASAGLRAILGEGAASRAAARVAGAGAAGAVEGAAYGLGSSIADAALENTDWTAERALSSMADGAWYGLGAGAIAGGVASALSAAGRRAVEKMTEGQTFRQAVEGFAEKAAAKSVIGTNAKIYNELTNFGDDVGRVQRLGRKLLDEGIPIDDLPAGVRAIEGKLDEAAKWRDMLATQADEIGVRVDAGKMLADPDVARVDAMRDLGQGSLFKRGESSFSAWKKAADTVDDPKVRQKVNQQLDEALSRNADGQAKRLVVEGSGAPQAQQATDLAKTWKRVSEDIDDFGALKRAGDEHVALRAQNKGLTSGDFGKGSVLALIAGGDVSSLLVAGATNMAHRFVRERGTGWLAQAADAIAKSEARSTRAAKVLAGSGKPARLATKAAVQTNGAKERSARFDDVFQHVEKMRRDPQYAAEQVEKIVAPLVREQPEVAAKMALLYQGDMAYLGSKMPRGVSAGANSFQPLKEKRRFGLAEKTSLVKAAEALADTPAAIDRIAEGEIDLDVIEALKVRRPGVFAELRSRVMSEAAALEDEMPFTRRNYLSMVFDFQGDPSLGSISAIQSSVATPPAEQQPPPKAPVDSQAFDSSLPSEKAGI